MDASFRQGRFEEWGKAYHFDLSKDSEGFYVHPATGGAWMAWKHLMPERTFCDPHECLFDCLQHCISRKNDEAQRNG